MLLKRIVVFIMSIFWALFAFSFVGRAAELPHHASAHPVSIQQGIR